MNTLLVLICKGLKIYCNTWENTDIMQNSFTFFNLLAALLIDLSTLLADKIDRQTRGSFVFFGDHLAQLTAFTARGEHRTVCLVFVVRFQAKVGVDWSKNVI